MTFSIYPFLNIIASLIVAGILTYKLTVRVHKFTCMERLGMGLIGAGSLMTIGPMLAEGTPFDDWTATLLRFGCAIYFIGRLLRHRHNNAAMVKQARLHFGKRYPKGAK